MDKIPFAPLICFKVMLNESACLVVTDRCFYLFFFGCKFHLINSELTAVAINTMTVNGIGLKAAVIFAPSDRLLLNHCLFKASAMIGWE